VLQGSFVLALMVDMVTVECMKMKIFIRFIAISMVSTLSNTLFAENIKKEPPVRIRSDGPSLLRMPDMKDVAKPELFPAHIRLDMRLGEEPFTKDLETLKKSKKDILARIKSLKKELAKEKKALEKIQSDIEKLTKAKKCSQEREKIEKK